MTLPLRLRIHILLFLFVFAISQIALDTVRKAYRTALTMGVRDIEEVCYSKVVIADQEDYSTLSKCHPQEQSSLFSSLPREIRDLIWGFATSPVEDPEHQYATNEYYYRPGHTARHKTCYNLLLTCRRVWLEANAMPMLQAEHAFWFYRAAPDARNPEWMEKLTAKNRMDFGVLKMFVQMFAIEGLSDEKDKLRRYFLDTREAANNFQPKVLHVTVG